MRPLTEPESPAPSYPDHWEADIVLRDGGTARLRPITAADADRLVSFFERVSEESKYYRFFAPYPRLSARDVHRFTHHDYVDRVGLAATVGGEFIATVRYDRIDERGRAASGDADSAEVAFLVEDAHQGRGLASSLLEHIAACARERGIRRFAAEVLPANNKMIKVFTDAGYSQRRSFADGSVHLTLDLEPTAASLEVMQAREQRAEARSVGRLLAPASVAVVGVGRRPGGAGRTVVERLREGGFTGTVHAVNNALPEDATELGGAPAHRRIADIPEPVDLAVLAVPADQLPGVVGECGEHGVRGLVVLATEHSAERQRSLVQLARAHGMRLIGPGAFGIINTDPAVRLNASPGPYLPRRGPIGLFTQSAAIGIAVLEELDQCGAGLSDFVSAGDRADVSGNDLLQHWYEDEHTSVALMYLESLGNPRKFTRLARRAALAGRPVVVVRGGRHSGGAPPRGHTVPVGHTPHATVSALLRQAGVVEAETVTDLVDTGLLLARQPLPPGDRVAVVGNAESLGLVAHDACRAHHLEPLPPRGLGPAARPEDFRAAVAEALADAGCDAVLVTAIPTVTEDSTAGPGRAEHVAALSEALRAAVADAGVGKPVLVAHLALDGLATELATHGIPAYPSAERAVRALGQAARHAGWVRTAGDSGRVPEFDDLDAPVATAVLNAALVGRPAPRGPADAAAGAVELPAADTQALLGAYGITVVPTLPAPDEDAARLAARRLGYPVALKTTAPHLRHRPDLGGVRLGLSSEEELVRAYTELAGQLGDPADLLPVVQPMAARGVDTVVRASTDPLTGAVLSFGLAGPASELLGDMAHRLLPVTDRGASELIRSIGAAPMLFGWRGAQPVDTAALEELLTRLGRLLDDHPQIAAVDLEPVVVASRGVHVLGAAVRAAPPPPRSGYGPRRLPTY
ncbi:bifunctional acetate--CoA ligase family protein/GNAT family N-acetyltransferase [Streptomyces lonarensis]|uniref:GNAT family N-acetyltransferase n=1 Tax=Streptomyces lonarensis TaxID=700599 RepID=A0A7X6CXZ4_9ACTN|nr:GNAT family N-acetyltransferase [Streptomyces lonarensis]NJQ04478.1 GNAT family N-acetyltransferase [Streptomyces lonarensis]